MPTLSELDTMLWLLGMLLVAAGLVGLVLPVIPGTGLIFAGLVVAAWAEGFAHVGWFTLVLIGLLALAAVAVDYAAGAIGAQRLGASRRAVFGAVAGALVGFFFGFVGILVGPFVGAILGELWARRDLRRAGKVGMGTVLGMAVGAVAKLAFAVAMIGLYALDRFFL